MRIELLYIGDCPHHAAARAALAEAIRIEQVVADVAEFEIKDASSACAIGFLGSPSIRIDGNDIETGASGTAGMYCRTYTESGLPKGVPSLETIRQALRNAQEVGCE